MQPHYPTSVVGPRTLSNSPERWRCICSFLADPSALKLHSSFLNCMQHEFRVTYLSTHTLGKFRCPDKPWFIVTMVGEMCHNWCHTLLQSCLFIWLIIVVWAPFPTPIIPQSSQMKFHFFPLCLAKSLSTYYILAISKNEKGDRDL